METSRPVSRGAPSFWVIAALYGILLLVGFIMLSSASSVVGYDHFGDSYYYVKHQFLKGFIPGLALAATVWMIPLNRWRSIVWPILGIVAVLLILVFVPGIGEHLGRAWRWVRLGPLVLQPSEILKFVVILAAAQWLAAHPLHGPRLWRRTLLPCLGAMGVFMVLVMAQPDMGTAAVLTIIGLTILYCAGLPLKTVTMLLAVALATAGMLIASSPYRWQRVLTFLNPSTDALGSSYHVNQAMIAISTGGWFGRGLGHSIQKFRYLPEVMSDSLFAIMAEELGFLMVTALLVLYGILIRSVLLLAQKAPSTFERLALSGIAVWLGAQMLINVAANVGLLPFTGVPLPLMGYGGTALAIAMASSAFVLRCAYQRSSYGS